MAEIITDIRGALRSGLYAARSMRMPSSTVISSTTGMDTAMGKVALTYIIKNPDIMKISPWAKFIRRSIP